MAYIIRPNIVPLKVIGATFTTQGGTVFLNTGSQAYQPPSALTPFQQYREWEKDERKKLVHVLIIERTLGEPSYRLTLTDRPYRDRGVDGVRYHDSFPPPINCIISEIKTTETVGRTSYADIVLVNQNGQLDDINNHPNRIMKQRFRVLRGDARWSLMETKLPNRFEEIFIGEIDDVVFERGEKIRLKVIPMKQNWDRKIGAVDQPVVLGRAINAPLVPVDEALHRYRINSIPMSPQQQGEGEYEGDTRIRDNGFPLRYATDYTLVPDSDGTYSGVIQLVAPPAGRLTGDVQMGPQGEQRSRMNMIVPTVIRNYLSQDYPEFVDSPLQNGIALLGWEPDGGAFFYCGPTPANALMRATVSTAYNINTITNVAANVATLGSFFQSGHFSSDGKKLWLIKDNPTHDLLYEYALASSFDIDSISLTRSINLTDKVGSKVGTFCITPDEKTIYFVTQTSNVIKASIDSGDISKIGEMETVLAVSRIALGGGTPWHCQGMCFSADGRFAYFTEFNSRMIHQVECPSPWDLSESFLSRRSLFYGPVRQSSGVAVGGGKIFGIDGSARRVRSWDLENGNLLPRDLYHANISHSSLLSEPAGVAYTAQTDVATAIRDLLTGWDAEYAIDRYGSVVAYSNAGQRETNQELFEINFYDFVFKKGQHIKQVGTEQPAYRTTVRYNKRQVVQQPNDLAAGISGATKSYYGKPYDEHVSDYGFGTYPNPQSMTYSVDTCLVSDSTVAPMLASVIGGYGLNEHRIFDFNIKLSSTSIFSRFGVGSFIRAGGDLQHPEFKEGNPTLRIRGREINWTKSIQKLTVERQRA